jgi:prepilin-type N-terminal cleavage/methylation domain-containing protein
MRIQRANTPRRRAFTLVEVLMAVGIFAMVLTAIYATWSSVMKGTHAGLVAAADAQRERMTRKVIEDALTTYQGFASSNYLIDVGQDGDFAYLSLVSRLPESFPGSGIFGGQAMRRVSFWVGADPKSGGNRLYMSQFPPLLATNDQIAPYVIPLAKDVTGFEIQFWDDQEGDFFPPESGPTNQMPKQIKVVLAFGGKRRDEQLRLSTSIIAPASTAVTAAMQGQSGGIGAGGGINTSPNAPGNPGFGGNPAGSGGNTFGGGAGQSPGGNVSPGGGGGAFNPGGGNRNNVNRGIRPR